MQLNWLFFLEQGVIFSLVITSSVLVIFVAAEMCWPRRQTVQSLSWRWGNNFSLSLLTWYVSHLVNLVLLLALARWTDVIQFGVFHHFEGPAWLPPLVLLVGVQFLAYCSHILFHHVPALWPLHAVHHADVDVDVSTSYRHHPLEPLVFMPLSTPLVVLLGVSPEGVLGYKMVNIFLTVFSHSNVRLPARVDNVLRKFIVTPDFHRVHHSSDCVYTNSNYGSIVPWFDYLFGTARHREYTEHETFELGLEYNRSHASQRLDRLLLAPVQRRHRVDSAPTKTDERGP